MYIIVRACHCVSSTRVPRYKCMKCVRGFIPLSKNRIKRYKHGFRGIVLSRKRSPSHFFIRTLYADYAHNAFTFALRSVRAYRFKSAHCAFTKRLLFAHRSFSVYISDCPVSSIRNSKVIGSVLEC